MEAFYKIHRTLINDKSHPHIRRGLQHDLDLTHRLIGIKGQRGVGKTSLLLDIARQSSPLLSRDCLYVNLNHLYFADRTIFDFGLEFYAAGGRLLLLDQIFKYPDWAGELAALLKACPELRIIFTTSAASPALNNIEPISKLVHEYHLSGFSLREYINYRTKSELPKYSLRDIIDHHEEIAPGILDHVNAAEFFNEYIKYGYYPGLDYDGQKYYETIVKIVNMTLEVDVVYLSQIDPSYLGKLRKLVYLMATQGGQHPNISALSSEIGTSRATMLNYLKMICHAGLLHLINKHGEHNSNKMGHVYANNTNLLQVMYPHIPSRSMERLVFMLSQLRPGYKVETPYRKSSIDLVVEEDLQISIQEKIKTKPKPNVYYALDYLNVGRPNEIPIWLFGFLY